MSAPPACGLCGGTRTCEALRCPDITDPERHRFECHDCAQAFNWQQQRQRLAGALITADGLYRYQLWRIFDTDKPQLHFLMLSPSTADGETDDPTVRRSVSFARLAGFGGIQVLNLFALRAKKPSAIARTDYGHAVGAENDSFLRKIPAGSPLVLAYGAQAGNLGMIVRYRADEVLRLLAGAGLNFMRLGHAKDGSPRHPLMMPKTAQLEALRTARAVSE